MLSKSYDGTPVPLPRGSSSLCSDPVPPGWSMRLVLLCCPSSSELSAVFLHPRHPPVAPQLPGSPPGELQAHASCISYAPPRRPDSPLPDSDTTLPRRGSLMLACVIRIDTEDQGTAKFTHRPQSFEVPALPPLVC